MPSIKAVTFDAYGTLAFIGEPRHPYRQLLTALRQQGTSLPADIAALVMSQPLSLRKLGQRYGASAQLISEIETDLAIELDTVQLYPDTLPAIRRLKAQGLKIGLCSNLTQPYAAPLLRLLPDLDAYLWSFEAGCIKPDSTIFRQACSRLGHVPAEVLMVGDSYKADIAGARAAELQAVWLRRGGRGGDLSSLDELLVGEGNP